METYNPRSSLRNNSRSEYEIVIQRLALDELSITALSEQWLILVDTASVKILCFRHS